VKILTGKPAPAPRPTYSAVDSMSLRETIPRKSQSFLFLKVHEKKPPKKK